MYQSQQHKTLHQIQMEKCVENALAFIETRSDLINFVIDRNHTLDDTGFMLCTSPLITEISVALEDDLHSGASMAITLRECQTILTEKYGTFDLRFKDDNEETREDENDNDYNNNSENHNNNENINTDENNTNNNNENINRNGCSGCIDDQPNQMAHMEPGGCLYENDDLDVIEEIHDMYIDTPPLVPTDYSANSVDPNTIEHVAATDTIDVQSTHISDSDQNVLGTSCYDRMDNNNKDIMDVCATAGVDAAVKAMFTDHDGVTPISYSEMRSRYG